MSDMLRIEFNTTLTHYFNVLPMSTCHKVVMEMSKSMQRLSINNFILLKPTIQTPPFSLPSLSFIGCFCYAYFVVCVLVHVHYPLV